MMSYLKMIMWLIKFTFNIWWEVLRAMVYVFKPTDMLVKSQVTLLLLGLHESIEDVPPLYNLREAVLEAMGMQGIEIPEGKEEETQE